MEIGLADLAALKYHRHLRSALFKILGICFNFLDLFYARSYLVLIIRKTYLKCLVIHSSSGMS